MKEGTLGLAIVAVSLLGMLVLNSAYVVDQAQMAVITEFGRPVGDSIERPGLHWRVPLIQHVHYFDRRILEWDGYPSEVPTRDKKFIWVDTTGRWRIVNPLHFMQTMRTEVNAQSRLDDIIDGITRNFITRYNLVDVVRSSNRILTVKSKEEDISGEEVYEEIEVGRDTITRQILDAAHEVVKEYGIEVIDLRIKRITYIQSVQHKVFERMISERKRAAESLRSEGQGIRAEIEGQKDKELKRITSEAYRSAQKIKGAADAEATHIYGEAYSKDPAFYAFTATLERYPEALREGRLLLTTESEFLKYLKKAE